MSSKAKICIYLRNLRILFTGDSGLWTVDRGLRTSPGAGYLNCTPSVCMGNYSFERNL